MMCRKKKEEFVIFGIILAFVFLFLIQKAEALNVTTSDNGTLMIVNITDAVNIYAYEVNFAGNGGNSAKWFRVLGGNVTGTNLKNGIYYVYESRLEPGWPGITFDSVGLRVFNLTHPNSVIPRQVTTVNASGFEETVNLCFNDSFDCGAWSSCVGGMQTRTCNSTRCLYGLSTQSQSCTTGGGGGGCTDSWICSEWGSCSGGMQTRTCTYTGNCATQGGKPAETQNCVSPCDQTWSCTNWTECFGGMQTRSCDIVQNGCTIPTPQPALTQSCVVTCIENWQCEWTACINNLSSPFNCNDLNSCGTQINRPVAVSCISTCPNPKVVCANWGECSLSYSLLGEVFGTQTRACHDDSGCLADITETRNCSLAVNITPKLNVSEKEVRVNLYDIYGNIISSILTSRAGDTIGFNITLNPSKYSIGGADYKIVDWTWLDVFLWTLFLLLLLLFLYLLLRKKIKEAWKKIQDRFYMKKLTSNKPRHHAKEKEKHLSKRSREIRNFFLMKNIFGRRGR